MTNMQVLLTDTTWHQIIFQDNSLNNCMRKIACAKTVADAKTEDILSLTK